MISLFLLMMPATASAFELRYIDSVHWPAVLEFKGSKVGGLSGLTQNPHGGYLAISDDRSANGDSRAYELSVNLAPSSKVLSVELEKVITLKSADGQPYGRNALDPESIVALTDGTILISSEGDTRTNPRIPPSVFASSPMGNFILELPLPEKFLPEPKGEQTKGALNNESLESLALSPDQQHLFAITESPLMQDGEAATFSHGGLVRMVDWNYTNQGFKVEAEYAYPLSAVPRILEGDRLGGMNGVSEVLALSNESWLVLERAYVANAMGGKNSVRLFLAEKKEAEDISSFFSLKSRNASALSKKLVLNFEDVEGLLPEGHRHTDNLEGMAWGPLTAEGHRTLLFVSDSNFNPTQETQFLLMEVLE